MYKSKLKYAEMLSFIPDKLYISLTYFMKTKSIINWKNPKKLNEKLQWLKIYNRNPEYTQFVDKYDVKKYIAKYIGEQYVIPTLGVWNKAEDIEWDKLPNQFVLKCTHDSHSVIICKDKKNINRKEVCKFLNSCMKHNLFWLAREWPYKNVKPRIMAEKLISSCDGTELVDYKFYCYGGKPQYFMYSVGEASHEAHNHKFNMQLESIDHLFKKTPDIPLENIKLPANIDEMIDVANKLAIGKPHVRIDLYNVDGKIYFGEETFFSGAGFINMVSKEYSDYLASLIELEGIDENKW